MNKKYVHTKLIIVRPVYLVRSLIITCRLMMRCYRHVKRTERSYRKRDAASTTADRKICRKETFASPSSRSHTNTSHSHQPRTNFVSTSLLSRRCFLSHVNGYRRLDCCSLLSILFISTQSCIYGEMHFSLFVDESRLIM